MSMTPLLGRWLVLGILLAVLAGVVVYVEWTVVRPHRHGRTR